MLLTARKAVIGGNGVQEMVNRETETERMTDSELESSTHYDKERMNRMSEGVRGGWQEIRKGAGSQIWRREGGGIQGGLTGRKGR